MNGMGLKKALGLKGKELISFYGAGGKSSLISYLAKELSEAGEKVVITTTTKIFQPKKLPCILTSDGTKAFSDLQKALSKNNVVTIGSALHPGNKLQGIESNLLEDLFSSCKMAKYWLVEADGAAGKPIKGHASYEPVIPPASSLILPVLGADAIGLTLNSENVHRAEIFSILTGLKGGEPVSVCHLICCLRNMLRLGRFQAQCARMVPVINKIDVIKDKNLLRSMVTDLTAYPDLDRFLFTSAKDKEAVKYVFSFTNASNKPYTACVILAAGYSSRMGEDKLMLKIKGKSILEHAISSALGSTVDETIVVSSPKSAGMIGLLYGDKVKVIENPNFDSGISSSLKSGINAVSNKTQAIIFALGDQPFIPVKVYNLLVEIYMQNLCMLIYPTYKGIRGNPVLFDRRTWPLLMKIEGDSGGMQIAPEIPLNEVVSFSTPFHEILVDIDTPEDFKKYDNSGH